MESLTHQPATAKGYVAHDQMALCDEEDENMLAVAPNNVTSTPCHICIWGILASLLYRCVVHSCSPINFACTFQYLHVSVSELNSNDQM